MTKMTREQAIKSYVEHLSGDDLAILIQHMNAYDGCFEESTYYDMDSFDELLDGYTPSEIARMIFYGGEFSPNDEYFHFNAYGNLESANWGDVVAEAEDLVDDIFDHIVNNYDGDTPWADLDYMVDADDDTVFDENFEEVDEEEEDQ